MLAVSHDFRGIFLVDLTLRFSEILVYLDYRKRS